MQNNKKTRSDGGPSSFSSYTREEWPMSESSVARRNLLSTVIFPTKTLTENILIILLSSLMLFMNSRQEPIRTVCAAVLGKEAKRGAEVFLGAC